MPPVRGLSGGSRCRGCWPIPLILVVVLLCCNKASAAPLHPHHRAHHSRTFVHTVLRDVEQATPEALYTQYLKAHPSPETAIVVEVGVFDGRQCAEAANAGFGRVYCFEPSPSNHENAQRYLAESKKPEWRNVELIQKAVGNQTGGHVEFHSIGGTGDHAGMLNTGEIAAYQATAQSSTIQVETIALDDFFNATDTVYLAKIDTQVGVCAHAAGRVHAPGRAGARLAKGVFL